MTSPKVAYSIASAADATDTSDNSVRRAIRSGQLKAHLFDRAYRIEHDDLIAWVRSWPEAA